MKFIIRGSKVEATKAIKEYIEGKIGRLDKYFEHPEEITANVLIRLHDIEQIVEVTIRTSKAVLRSEERNKDLYAAIDLVSDKMERQIRKNKTKMKKKSNKKNFIEFNTDFEVSEEDQVENKIVKRKKLDTKPMSEEEAILQMDLLGHDFFIYKDAKKNDICVIYKRKDGNYGLIESNE